MINEPRRPGQFSSLAAVHHRKGIRHIYLTRATASPYGPATAWLRLNLTPFYTNRAVSRYGKSVPLSAVRMRGNAC
jgi:hypothetical protein